MHVHLLPLSLLAFACSADTVEHEPGTFEDGLGQPRELLSDCTAEWADSEGYLERRHYDENGHETLWEHLRDDGSWRSSMTRETRLDDAGRPVEIVWDGGQLDPVDVFTNTFVYDGDTWKPVELRSVHQLLDLDESYTSLSTYDWTEDGYVASESGEGYSTETRAELAEGLRLASLERWWDSSFGGRWDYTWSEDRVVEEVVDWGDGEVDYAGYSYDSDGRLEAVEVTWQDGEESESFGYTVTWDCP